jgi:peptidyl-prolyl cis-trans isomerase D
LEQAAGPVVISDDELKKEYVKRNDKIKLSYVIYDPNTFSKGLSSSDQEAKTFYDAHREEFRQPPMINVEYVHLLYPEKATNEQKQAVKKQAAEAVRDFSKQTLKESGFFTQSQPLLTCAWSPEFVDNLFTMKQGETSAPVEAPDGMQIVRIKERKESAIPEFKEIVEMVKKAMTMSKAIAAAQAKAQEDLKVLNEAVKTKKFSEAAAGLGLKTQETDAFARGEYINAPGLIAEFQPESMNLNEQNKLSNVVETSQGPAILYLNSVEKVDDKKFAEDKEDFRQMMTAQKQNQAVAMFVNKLKLEANVQSETKEKIRYR